MNSVRCRSRSVSSARTFSTGDRTATFGGRVRWFAHRWRHDRAQPASRRGRSARACRRQSPWQFRRYTGRTSRSIWRAGDVLLATLPRRMEAEAATRLPVSCPRDSTSAGRRTSRPAVAGDPDLQSSSGNLVNPNLIADARPPRVSRTPPESDAKISEAERAVFGGRKVYSLSLNMPNLNSGGGSWIIHFAALTSRIQLPGQFFRRGSSSDLSSPVATRKVDPAYPLELMRKCRRDRHPPCCDPRRWHGRHGARAAQHR